MNLVLRVRAITAGTSISAQSRRGRILILAAIGVALVVSVSGYILMAHFGRLPTNLEPASILHKPLPAVVRGLHVQSPEPSSSGSESASTRVLGEQTTNKVAPSTTTSAGSTSFSSGASSAPASASNGQLIISPNVVTISTSNIYADVTATLASHANIHQPVVNGSMKDVEMVFLADTYQSSFPTWGAAVSRVHPDGSGVSVFTITAQDDAGKTYSGTLTVNWPPVPYFSITNAHVAIGSGQDSLGDPATAVTVTYTLVPSANFGSHQLKMTWILPYPYSCDGSVGLSQTITYDGSQNNYSLSCMLSTTYESTYRATGGEGTISINSDIFSKFGVVQQTVPIPTW